MLRNTEMETGLDTHADDSQEECRDRAARRAARIVTGMSGTLRGNLDQQPDGKAAAWFDVHTAAMLLVGINEGEAEPIPSGAKPPQDAGDVKQTIQWVH